MSEMSEPGAGVVNRPTARTGRPHEFFWVWHAAQFSFGTVVLGAVPVSFGLSWWATVSAVLAGLAVGSAVFAPLVRVSIRTGVGDLASSGAQFGIRGRLLTAAITLAVCLVFFAVAVWTGATAVLVAGERMYGTPTGRPALAAAFVPAVAAGMLLLDNPLLQGPLAGVAGGLDLSWIVPFLLAATVFRLLRGGLAPARAVGTPAPMGATP